VSLLDAELRRLFARRLVRGLLLGAVLIILVVQAVIAIRADVVEREVPLGNCMTFDPATGQAIPCPDSGDGTAFTQIEDRRPRIGENLEGALEGMAVGVLLASVVIGASFVGADFGAGALPGQLLFEPRRSRVLLTKAATVALGMFLCAVGICALLSLAMLITSQTRGVVEGLDREWVADRVADVLRLSTVGAIGGVIGLSIVAVVRRTAAAIVVMFGLVIIEPLLLNRWDFFDSVPLVQSMGAFVTGSWDPGQFEGIDSLAEAARVLVLWTAAFVAVATAVFARREVR
jgi:hypothetical protein